MNLAILPNPKPGFKSADTQFSGLCFSAAFCEFQQQIVQRFNAFLPVIVHFMSSCLLLLFDNEVPDVSDEAQ